jgi:hypothetical protein
MKKSSWMLQRVTRERRTAGRIDIEKYPSDESKCIDWNKRAKEKKKPKKR